MATIDQIGYRKITKNEEAAKEVIGYQGIVQFQPTAAAGFVPYPNPRYAMRGGHQDNTGGMQ